MAGKTIPFECNFPSQGLEDSMRRNAVRSIGAESSLFDQKELEQLYAVFKVILILIYLQNILCPLSVDI